ncbi:hypothetical protein D3C85_1135410 [compost metagenome]
MMGHLADFKQVIGHARHDLPCFVVVIEPEAQLLQVVKHLFAHIRFDVNPQLMPPVGHDEMEQCVQAIDS